jgi:hypothetical protein
MQVVWLVRSVTKRLVIKENEWFPDYRTAIEFAKDQSFEGVQDCWIEDDCGNRLLDYQAIQFALVPALGA